MSSAIVCLGKGNPKAAAVSAIIFVTSLLLVGHIALILNNASYKSSLARITVVAFISSTACVLCGAWLLMERFKKKIKHLKRTQSDSEKLDYYQATLQSETWFYTIATAIPITTWSFIFLFMGVGDWVCIYFLLVLNWCDFLFKAYFRLVQEGLEAGKVEAATLAEWTKFNTWIENRNLPLQRPADLFEQYRQFVANQ